MDRRKLLGATLAAGAGVGAGMTATPGVAHAATPTPPGRLRVQLIVFDGVDELDFIGPVDVFGIARKLKGDVQATLLRPGGTGLVTGSHGTRFAAEERWAPEEADVILVPGGRLDEPRRALPQQLTAARRPGLVIAGVCTGVRLLAEAGITAGRPCVTHHEFLQEVRDKGGVIKKARVVDDGDLVTAGGITSGIDLALWLVERYCGAELALRVEEIMEYERRGTVWHA
ncbi:DJ-1/PfpI family protein [Actinoplanes sp. NPDC051859]|uniref:DJ-1/PfpI family protein n=1 Tax=Actinoplanes sp. NPDC051859 TaxID=3363909 RepID=UPI0037B05641